ncbi:uncharacterized protein LOC126839826 isoform X1 [Adelges cooleyi]|uniref:uncharacterized protein LOC126839826 isoform X1 n=1 Tax=Adelges cooleyi TaxID=133065 RepID=UPI00218049F2|nr:uncharacterized protein LOC126839826 isoform X1 [Adelges cooleyi]
MIEINCIFWSLYFIQTVNFMMIEAPYIVSPSYYVNKTFTHSYVNTVNSLITYNEREIKISDKERTILTTPIQTYKDTKDRNKVFNKFDKKIKDIKCTCSLIVKTKLAYLSNILEGLQSGGAIEVAKDKLIELKEEAGLMILLFQKGNVKAGKWFWSYYFKIMAIIEYESNKHLFAETPFGEEELQSGISHFLQYCKINYYLPKNKPEYDLVSKIPNVPNNIFQKLRVSEIIAVHYANVMQYISIEYLYLKPLWDDHELLFGEITGSTVEWRPTIRRHADEVSKTKEYIKTREWVSKPFGHLSYHKLIKQIISVRIYTVLWVMLVIFNKEMPQLDLFRLKIINMEANQTIIKLQKCMHYTESLFFELVAGIKGAMHENPLNFDSIIAGISKRVKDILVELNGRSSNGSDWISVNINGDFTYDMIMEFLQELSNNFSQLNEKLTILNYELALNILVEGN